MEEERFISTNFDDHHQLCQGFQADKFVVKGCLNIPETISGQSHPSLSEDNLKIQDAPKVLVECFSSNNRENIGSNNSVISDESTVCAIFPVRHSNLMKCEKKLLESSSDEVEKMPVNGGKLSQFSKKLKFLNDTISTPPSALREQISVLRKEMNEAYEFHDLEIQILKEERKEDPESYAQLIEKYSTLFELYTSLKNEYEDYRRDQEKIRDELQSKTVDCLESLCSQIETSDNSLNSASFMSFILDFKSSTMIGNSTERETTLQHDVTFQTKDPLSDTDVFKTPQFTPLKSAKKIFPQNLDKKQYNYDVEQNIKLMEIEIALSDKTKEAEILEQRLFKIEDLSGILQNEFERISSSFLKENETLKESLLNKSEQLDALTQKLFTEIISLNPDLADSLVDTPGTKLLPVFIETIMERFKNIEEKLIMKFSIEKSDWETKVNDLEEKNKNLNEQITSHVSAIQELKKLYESQLLETENRILTRNEENRFLKTHDSNMREISEDLASEEEEVIKLESQLSLANNRQKEVGDRCRVIEKANDSLLDLEKIKKLFGITQDENNKLNERISKITTENRSLQELCELLKQQLSEYEDIISSRDEEILNLKHLEIKQMKADIDQADKIILKMKAELFATESEKLNFEKRCLELENANAALQTVISTKDTVLKDLEGFKSACESEWEKIKQQIKEREVIISDLRLELDKIKEKYFMEVKIAENLNEKINCQTSAFAELEKSYKDTMRKLLDAESKMQMQDEEIRILQSHDTNIRQTQDDLASAKQVIRMLEAKLLSAHNDKMEVENRCQALEEKSNGLCTDLENIKSAYEKVKLENENFKDLIHQKNKELKFESLFEVLKEAKKILTDLLESNIETENLALKLISEKILNLPDILKLIENIVDYFNVEWEGKKNILIRNFQSEIKVTNEQLCEIKSENSKLQEMCEQLETDLREAEGIISLRDQEILNFSNQAIVLEQLKAELVTANENALKLKDELLTKEGEKLECEKRYVELEDKNVNLLSLITTKDTVLKDLEVFKSLQEKECENLKRQIMEKEDIISNLKAELDKLKENHCETIKSIEIDNVLASFQLGCEKLAVVLGSGKCSEMQEDDLLKLMAELKSPYTETEGRILTQFMSAVFHMGNKLLHEWEVQKSNDSLSIRELENKFLDVKQREAEFQSRCLVLEEAKTELETKITMKDLILKDLEDFKSFHDYECVKIKQQLEENEEIISTLKTELSLLKENYNEEIKTVEKEKLESQKRCLELEDANSDLRAAIAVKDSNLNELRHFNCLYESDSKNMKQQIQEREEFIINLKTELKTLKEQFNEDIKRLNVEKINLEERCLELEDAKSNLQTVITSKDIILNDLEYFKSFHQTECEPIKRQIEEKEKIISNLQIELFTTRKKWNEEIQKMEGEKIECEKRCVELEGKNVNLLSLITTKDTVLKDLEVFKSLQEKECENLKRQIMEKEDIISNLKAELNKLKENHCETIKSIEIDNVLASFQLGCEKLAVVLGSGKCSEMQKDDLLKLMAELKSPDTETEGRILTQFMSAVFHMGNKLLHEWEVQKGNNFRLIKELENKILNFKRQEADFDNLKQVCDNFQGKISEEVLFNELAVLEKLRLSSGRDFPKVMKKVMVHVRKLHSRAAELKEENEKLDEECDSYAKVIKDLKKEAAIEWKKNNEKIEVLEGEILRLTKMKNDLEYEKEELRGKISKLEEECQKLKANIMSEGTERSCGCEIDFKKVNELKRTILVKEQKLLELQDMEAQNNSYKSQIEYLKNALDKERKKINEEREKNKKMQNELNGGNQQQKADNKKFEDNEILEELRLRGSISGGVVQEIVDKEKMRKLSKDVGVLKEICRARYAEIKRLEAENAALKNFTPKNSNQMDSPIRSRGYNTRSRGLLVEKWKTETGGKENKAV